MTLSWEISNGIFPDLNVLDSYQSVKCVKVLVKSSVFRHGFHNPPHAVLGPVLPAAAWSRGSGYSQESYEWGAETLAKPQTSAPPLHYSSFTLSCWNGPCCCQWTCVGLWWGLRWEILSENPMGSVPDNCILIPDYCPSPVSRVLSEIPWSQRTILDSKTSKSCLVENQSHGTPLHLYLATHCLSSSEWQRSVQSK